MRVSHKHINNKSKRATCLISYTIYFLKGFNYYKINYIFLYRITYTINNTYKVNINLLIINKNISKKIDRYHPKCDYLNNLSYSCFGHLRGFKLNKIPSFEITNPLACAEDSYHVFWSNSYGKYLHIPRPLYKWTMRDDSESHSIGPKPGFNDNFEIALNKLKSSDYGVDMIFNDVYLETCSLGSYTIEGLKNKKVSFIVLEICGGGELFDFIFASDFLKDLRRHAKY